MNLEQLRARLAEISAQLEGFKANASLEAEDIETVETLSAEFNEISAKISAMEKIESITAKAAAPAPRKAAPAPVAPANRADARAAGFKSLGDFAAAVRNPSADARFKAAMYERSGEEGGYMVPEEMLTTILKKLQSDDSLLAATTQFALSGNAITMPIDETAPWAGAIQAYWASEGQLATQSGKAELGQASLKLNKLIALTKVSDELLSDSTALDSYLNALAPTSIMNKINEAILTGNGVGKPKGILNSGFKVKVAKESGQAPDTILAPNVINMYSRLLPSSRGVAKWYINPMCEAQLRTMKDDNGNYIYLAASSQMNGRPYDTLLGLPIVWMMGGVKELGTEGDIILADMSYVYSAVKASGIKNAISAHLNFDQDLVAYKWTFRVDANIPFTSPVKTQNGNYEMSAVVTLEDR